jgi:hypothetical protein
MIHEVNSHLHYARRARMRAEELNIIMIHKILYVKKGTIRREKSNTVYLFPRIFCTGTESNFTVSFFSFFSFT